MYRDGKIWLGLSGREKVCLEPAMANRHGCITGATGTGKTTTLRVLAQSFSDCGVPVFLADVKGDLAEMLRPGRAEGFVGQRIAEWGLEAEGFRLTGCPVAFWDIYGQTGMPLRTTVTEMGPLLLSRVLGLNATQEAILTVLFKAADDEGLLLIDTKDLRALLQYAGENAKTLSARYGNMSKQSLAAIIRAVIALETEGGDRFFGEPALSVADWLTRDPEGRGTLNLLDCRTLVNKPRMYGTFLLWMLSELYETLPEVGDQDRPRMIFFFDEAHLLFDNAGPALMEKVEQVVKLIRSKGVGVYFITQSPGDIPDGVLAQLNNKIQHGLRAYTPAEQRAVKAAAASFRPNPDFDTYEAICNLGIGEALVSVLQPDGIPSVVKKTLILPPQCGNGTLPEEERRQAVLKNDLYLKYADPFDRDSAWEFLQRRFAEAERQQQEALAAEAAEKARQKEEALSRRTAKNAAGSAGSTIGREIGGAIGGTIGGKFGKKLGRSIGASLGRGLMGNFFGK